MKHLNSTLALVMFSFFLVSCTQDNDNMDESLDLTTQDAINLTKIIDPSTARAAAQFDNTTNGIYKGIFVSNDLSYHGVLTVNLGNDGRYNAILEYGEGQGKKIGFLGEQSNNDGSSNIYEFRGKNGGFTIDLSNQTSPIITKATIDGQTAQGKLLKETSQNQVRAVLGTFEDSNDTSFNGTWDFLTSGTRVVTVPTGLAPPNPAAVNVTVNIVADVVLTKGGMTFNDNSMESFTVSSGCNALLLPTGVQTPFVSGPQSLGGIFMIDEYAAPDQTSIFLGEVATWNLVYSTYQDSYFNGDCSSSSSGSWSWKGRTGTITLD
jgi:hypothetical protein